MVTAKYRFSTMVSNKETGDDVTDVNVLRSFDGIRPTEGNDLDEDLVNTWLRRGKNPLVRSARATLRFIDDAIVCDFDLTLVQEPTEEEQEELLDALNYGWESGWGMNMRWNMPYLTDDEAEPLDVIVNQDVERVE